MINAIISKRKSIRKFKDTEITNEQIKTMLEAAMLAPSACGSRPWKFVVIRSRKILDSIMSFHPYTGMFKTSNVGILVIGDLSLQSGISDGFMAQDCGAATQNILLQAASEDIGTCWCGVYNERANKHVLYKEFQKLLGLAEHEIPFSLIAVGASDEEWGSRGHYDDSKVTWIE